ATRDDGLVDLAKRAPAAGLPPPRLLGAYDPLLHGWVDRTPVLGDHTGIVTVNGLFRPFALVRGRAAGIWSLTGGTVQLTPFAPFARADRAALDADADDVVRFLG
ncbi:MAG: crosslink repair DNA glycosylase YcaQ family protein, partial [Conexibacter sp.]